MTTETSNCPYYVTTVYTLDQETETLHFETAKEAIRHVKQECRYENTVQSTAYARFQYAPITGEVIYQEDGDFTSFHKEAQA